MRNYKNANESFGIYKGGTTKILNHRISPLLDFFYLLFSIQVLLKGFPQLELSLRYLGPHFALKLANECIPTGFIFSLYLHEQYPCSKETHHLFTGHCQSKAILTWK